MTLQTKEPRALLVVLTLMAFASLPPISSFQSQAFATTSNPTVNKLSATGYATEASATSCTNVTCATADTCDFYTLTGTILPFSSFGPGLANPNIVICISEDSTNAVSNGNDGTLCGPASGAVMISKNTGKFVTMSLVGQVCTLPATPESTTITVVNSAFAITSSSVKTVSGGSGTFSAFFSSVSGSTANNPSSLTFTGNFFE
jgi:hypothetical protein